MSITGIVSDLDSWSSIRDSQLTVDLDPLAFFVTFTRPLYIATPPSFDIDFEFTVDEVLGAAWTTFVPVSRYWPLPANVIPVNSDLAFSPLKTLIGYRQDTFEPNDPDTHSIAPSFSTMALFVFRLYIFLDQFSIVEYLSVAPS